MVPDGITHMKAPQANGINARVCACALLNIELWCCLKPLTSLVDAHVHN